MHPSAGLNSVSIVSESVSITLSITGVTGSTPAGSPSKSDQKCVVFLYNAKALSSNIHRPILPVMIQSIMPHIQLRLNTDINDSSSPSIRCMVDTANTLCTGNYHFFSAIAKRFPQCVAQIFLPEDYSPIIVSGIIQDNTNPITTDLPVAFQFYLLYLTKDGSATFFVVATGPQVSVNMDLGLPLIKATGMIIKFIDKVVKAKHFDCPPFPINFRCATKTIPANDACPTNYIEFKDVQQVLEKTDAYIAGVCKRFALAASISSVCFSESTRSSKADWYHPGDNAARILGTKRHHRHVSDSTEASNQSIAMRWIPPILAHITDKDYHNQILGDAGYL
jgi:hypothetical protein